VKRRITDEGRVTEFECKLLTKTGAVKQCMISGNMYREQGAIEGSVLDITDRKRAEEDKKRIEEQLFHAQKMEAIGTLAGGIAHDFNNILGGILAGLSLIELRLGSDSLHDAEIQEIKGLVLRGADVVGQLLGFARRGKYTVRPVDLAKVIKKMRAMFGRTRRDLTIQYDFAPGLKAVLMDNTQLEQVLLNLFLNAGHAMPDGGRLMLRARDVALSNEQTEVYGVTPGCFVELVIADTGVGMDAATQARIFEPFFTTKPTGLGSGLGLASVYGIIKNHGGMITVDSELGKGTAFTLFLPATDLHPEKDVISSTEIHRGEGTILVVDDEVGLLTSLSKALETLGYKVLTAIGGAEAVEIVREHRDELSLVILDLIMPEMSGAKTYDALRKIAPKLKVLLSSGYSIEGQADELLARGYSGFIQKPFDLARLSAKLKEIL
jgi:two-component system, cell cycle sensor histidine kinase and response regulator CckA